MSYTSLMSFYETQTTLKLDHGYSIDEQLEMYPFERDLHVNKIIERLRKLKAAREE
jgi:hypothetical protein